MENHNEGEWIKGSPPLPIPLEFRNPALAKRLHQLCKENGERRRNGERPLITIDMKHGEHPKVIANKDEFEMLGRNDLCSCGSGKKYKKCCLK